MHEHVISYVSVPVSTPRPILLKYWTLLFLFSDFFRSQRCTVAMMNSIPHWRMLRIEMEMR